MLAHLYYYAKAYVAALSTGVLYLATVIGPDLTFSDLGHVSLLHWIGFAASVLGIGGLTAVVTNGEKPAGTASTGPATSPGTDSAAITAPATAAVSISPTVNPAPTLTVLAPVADTSLPATVVSQPASTGAVDGGFQSKIEAAISGATPAVDPAPAATPAPAAVPATPAQ